MPGKKYDLFSISPAVVMSVAWLLGWGGMHENVMITVILPSPAQPAANHFNVKRNKFLNI